MKKTVSSVLAAIILSGSCTYAQETHWDLAAPSAWASEDIEQADKIGILNNFKVGWTRAITREQFCTLAYNTLYSLEKVDSDINIGEASPFTDTENEKIIILSDLEIIEGKSEGVFAPDDTLTREEAAVIMYRIADFTEAAETAHNDMAYSDDSDISDWAKWAVYEVNYIGLMQGTDKGFEPKERFTVEQSVAALMRVYRLVSGSDGTDFLSFEDRLNNEMPNDKNYLFSPLSVEMALAMAANGADGQTRDEILRACGIADIESRNGAIKLMLREYTASELLKLNVSNSIWINSDNTNQRFSKEYEALAKDIFDADADIVTTADAPARINGWVNDKTNGKIPTVIDEDNIDFGAMLINAVYFKGRWQSEFDKASTEKDTFTDRSGKKTDIDFMNKTSWIGYAEKNGVQIAELPYLTCEDKFTDDGEYIDSNDLNLDISMYLMMSDEDFNPNEILNSVEISTKYIALSMPKFKIEYSVSLNDTLKNIGIEKAFTESADFSDMFDSGNMWITDTIHKTYIDVDEEGTEAAAVTGIGMAGSALPPEPTAVKFNKPFTFVIRDNMNGELLFMGEYSFAE